MESQETDSVCSEEANHLNRNRSFKSKQLVRSQAIRESQSPPRTVSPCINVKKNEIQPSTDHNSYPLVDSVENKSYDDNVEKTESCCGVGNVKNNVTVVNVVTDVETRTIVSSDDSSLANSDGYIEGHCCDEKKQQVEIQITPNSWDDMESSQQRRCRRWSANKSGDSSRDLLSNSPRVTCVCGTCACPHCRGRRREHACPTKQDSGIVCDVDNSDSEVTALARSESMQRCGARCECERRESRPHARNDHVEDKSELSGADLVKFIKDTLNKNPRDRVTLLKIERELHELVNDHGRTVARFPATSSYARLLVHRAAALFHLAHRLDPASRQAVLVSKSGTSGGQIPCTQFKQWCSATFPEMQHSNSTTNTTNAKSILKRATQSLEESGSGSFAANRSKSLQQREKEYERVRSRIFSEENCRMTDESQWPWLSSGPVKLLTADSGRKLLKVQSLEAASSRRRVVSKSHSFAGEQQHGRLLSTQGSLASSSWRLSPSSSGYKTLSLRSTDSVTPSPTGGASPEPTSSCSSLMWAHAQTGRVVRNPNGSLYHAEPATYDQTQVDQNNDRRRGRLQKQQSFMDNECECQPPPASECSNKCYCECQQRENIPQQYDKPPPQLNQTTHPSPSSPNKTRYDNSNIPQYPPRPTNHNPEPTTEPTNHKASETKAETPKNVMTNQRPPSYDQAANQKISGDVAANQRPGSANRNKLCNQELHYVPQTFYVPYRSEDVTSLLPHKMAPLDHGLRPMFANVIYPTQMPPTYPYMNTYRPDQHIQPAVYQQVTENKPAPHTDNGTFRIDPSYPFPAVEYSQCGACADNYHAPPHGYNIPYGQMEVPSMVPTNMYPQPMVLPPAHYPYQEQVGWGAAGAAGAVGAAGVRGGASPALLLHELYPYCGLVCPPVQSYPVFAEQARQHASARTTPLAYTTTDRSNDERIQQNLTQQMAAVSTRDRCDGILGNGPASNDESQLTSAARAIVNSIRSMQAKNHLSAAEGRERRREYTHTQVPPANWYKRSPAPVYPVLNHPRRPHPNARNERR